MVAVVDETTGMIYLFGEPNAAQKMDDWSRDGSYTYDAHVLASDVGGVVDFSFLDLEALVAA